ncbi:protein PFC0760c-like [Galleria mellonella]|uniref:Protein PFC0760c-like n=1 Tax=Galleria mellonella TaxID=7137 RepID=A0ABM3MA65_GALME|nr:protein PFC0760c-like [Galleria mellonella]
MDRTIDSKLEKQSIYEIYRGCRLCGAGAGYKMPIIQTVVDLDGNGMELRQKIQECVQIEINPDDKMPPLICELCVDKVNDFYDFMEMCKQTNKRTRLRLGLPVQVPAKNKAVENTRESRATQTTASRPTRNSKLPSPSPPRCRSSREENITLSSLKTENKRDPGSGQAAVGRITRNSKLPSPSPPRSRNCREENMTLSSLKQQVQKDNKSKDKQCKDTKDVPKSILKRRDTVMADGDSLLMPRNKRSREVELLKLDTPVKKVKLSLPPATGYRRRVRAHGCCVCGHSVRTPQALVSHQRTHAATYTDHRLACNPCCAWFSNAEEVRVHQKRHASGLRYNCHRCSSKYKTLNGYNEHLEYKKCHQLAEVADVKCERCGQAYPTDNLLRQHRCHGGSNRATTCTRCGRVYASPKTLRYHMTTCSAKKKDEVKVDPEVQKRLLPVQVRVARCDPLLDKSKGDYYDVSSIATDYGFDTTCVYPYKCPRIKTEPLSLDRMVSIEEEVKEELCSEEYIHWDSDSSDSDCGSTLVNNPMKNQVDTLSTLSIKTIFSLKFLGKVPRKRRKVKTVKCIDEDDFNNVIKGDTGGYDSDNSVDSVSIMDSLLNDSRNKGDSVNWINDNDRVFSNNTLHNNDVCMKSASENELPNASSDNNDAEVNKLEESLDVSMKRDTENNRCDNDVPAVNDSLDCGGSVNKNNIDDGTVITNSLPQSNDVSINEATCDFEGNKDDQQQSNECSNSNNKIIVPIVSEAEPHNEFNVSILEDKNNTNKENVNTETDTKTVYVNNQNSGDTSIINNAKETNHCNDSINLSDDKNYTSDYIINNKSLNNDVTYTTNECIEKAVNNFTHTNGVAHNDYGNTNREIHNGEDKPIDTDNSKENDSELEDKKLMDDIDQQIGESCDDNHKNNDITENNDKVSANNEDTIENGDAIEENNVERDGNTTMEWQEDREKVNDKNKNNLEDLLPKDIGKAMDLDRPNIEIANGESDKQMHVDNSKDVSDTEMEDKKLMEALDKQIGEFDDVNERQSNENNKVDGNNDYASANNENVLENNRNTEENALEDEKNKDKITLEDLLPKEDLRSLKSLDLDSISDDDFDFDA